MKRSEINAVYEEARECFLSAGWSLPPNAKWDITDFGLGDFGEAGLTLINLAEEPEYCEKLMYARVNQLTPAHTHQQKKEDIICRKGTLVLQLWDGRPDSKSEGDSFSVQINGELQSVEHGGELTLNAGERITLTPGIYHAFWAGEEGTVLGEVSTANDDANDNFFLNKDIGRFPGIEEDEAPKIRLISEASA